MENVFDSGETKVAMTTEAIFIRFYMAGAILMLAAVFTVTVQFGQPLKHVSAMSMPVRVKKMW